MKNRPDPDWIYDDNGSMPWFYAQDFTSAVFDGKWVGIVVSVARKGPDGELYLERVQVSFQPSLALALSDALASHVASIPLKRG